MPLPKHPLPEHAPSFREALLAWYRVHQRKLPWRERPSLYKTVVSEFMLQQTQIKTALPYFHAWMERFPDFHALAQAPEGEVLKAWEGLGYYSRARNLHRLAQTLDRLPEIPRERGGWLELPGIGPYTSAAITSIALEQPHACVDGNVVRILSRLTADGTEYRDSSTAAKAMTPLAELLLSPTEPGDHNQAMMELGATVCHRRKPLCTLCPVLTHCQAGVSGNPEDYPGLAAKKMEKVETNRVWCTDGDTLLLHKGQPGARRLAHLHELPSFEHLALEKLPAGAELMTRQRRSITRFQIVESIFLIQKQDITPAQLTREGLTWVQLTRLDEVSLSGPHRRWIRALRARHTT